MINECEGKIKPDDVTVQEFWSALDLSLSQLTEEFKESPHRGKEKQTIPSMLKPVEYQKSFPAPEETKKRKISKMKVGQPINIIKLPIPLLEKAKSSGDGVNHLNLIQIKGNPIHNWQPKLVFDPEGKSPSISRPELTNIHINKILIKHLAASSPSCSICNVARN